MFPQTLSSFGLGNLTYFPFISPQEPNRSARGSRQAWACVPASSALRGGSGEARAATALPVTLWPESGGSLRALVFVERPSHGCIYLEICGNH